MEDAALDQLPDGAGAIGLLSSDEFTDVAEPFDRALLPHARSVGLLLCADHRNAATNAARARDHMQRLGARATALNHDEPVPGNIDLVYIGGGTPTELLECLLNRPVGVDLLARWRAGLTLAGASAGAMALSVHCLVPEPGGDKPTVWSKGLGPLTQVGLAVHASSRPTSWLEQVRATARVPLLVLDDGAGVILAPRARPWSVGGVRILSSASR